MPKAARLTELHWPGGGVSVHTGFTHQDPGTCVDALNVRGYDPTTNALRGASRCGLTKFVTTQVNGSAAVQNINHVSVAAAASGSTNSVRTLKGIAVAGGNIRSFTSTGFGATTGGVGALNSTAPFVSSSILFSKVYYADGSNYVLWDAATDAVSAWAASAGALPVSGGNRPRLICTWRGRIVLSGMIGDPQNWFMSAQYLPLNWDYSPAITSATMAVAGNNTEAGQVPDLVNALMPYSDDLLIVGGDNSIWQITEDPAAGGQIDRLSDIVGVAFGDSWCKDPYGNIYFMSSRGGFYTFRPGGPPQRLSALRIDEKLMTIDWSKNLVRMVYDDRFQTVQFYITPTAGGATINWAYDLRNEAFWPDQFASATNNPTAVHLMDGDNPNDRAVILGTRDGYLKFIDVTAKSDDGDPITSYILHGPLQSDSGLLRVKEMRCILGEYSDPVTVELFAGHSPEDAFISNVPRYAGTLTKGRNYAMRPMALEQCFYVKFSQSWAGQAWQFETAYLDLVSSGLVGGRPL